MKLVYDRQITISIGASCKDMNWKPQRLTVSELYARCKTPLRGTESCAEYGKLNKAQRSQLKDVGGFMAGTLAGGRRKASAVTGRDVITLDFDTIPAYGTDPLLAKLDSLGIGYCAYSTRSHIETKPRIRILIPLDRTVTAEEYEPIARRVADTIGIQMADPTTFEASRLMYWPSCCADGVYVYHSKDAAFASADAMLASYTDWHNYTSWPQVPGSETGYRSLAVKQGLPESKAGIVGAFNRTRGTVMNAMDKDIPGVYEPVETSADRYTYTGGTTTGGAVVYDEGRFLFSHHSTDPCSGKLVNAFDMVRLHKFGNLDESVSESVASNRLPSYKAMCEYAVADPDTAALMARERHEEAVKDFEGIGTNNADDAANWMAKLEINAQTGAIKPTIDNVRIILDCDPLLKNRFALNEFANRGEVFGALPWSNKEGRRLWSDTDNNGLYWYMEKAYGITKRGNIDAALDIHAATHAFNEVQTYLDGLSWDGTPRLDTVLIDYLGAADTPYTRAVSRKSFTAAVARAVNPGCKFDNMLILCGAQGIGKSTLVQKMSHGWFNDNIRTFEGKEASELLQGVWLVEVAELDAFRRTDVARIKQFLSLQADRYRAAYGRNVKELPRRCVFFGTCNEAEFLQDTTGNRRFWPVDVGEQPHTRNVWRDLTPAIIDQMWAEAKARKALGETLYLTGEIEKQARAMQEQHRESAAQEGIIAEFVEKKIPDDWLKWPIDRRRGFWAGAVLNDGIRLVGRDRITAIEIWCELYGKNKADISKSNTKDINSILKNLPGWHYGQVRPGGEYGSVKGYTRE